MYWTRNPMNNVLAYCGLVDAKIRDSDIDLPVLHKIIWLYENKIVAPNLDTVHWQFVSTKNTRLAKYKAGFSIQIQYTKCAIFTIWHAVR